MPARPVVDARRLGLRLSGGWVFRSIDLVVPPSEVVALVGPDDGPRTQLLRTLAVELMPTEGSLHVCGHPVPAAAPAAKAGLVLAALPDHVVADTTAQVGDAVRTRLLLSDIPQNTDLFDAAADLVGLSPDRDAMIAELSHLQRRLLAVALAAMTPVQLILLDGADRDLGPVDRQTLWRALGAVARTGPAVVAGARIPTAHADQVLTVPSGTSKFIP